jgi:hypothetical protein
VFFRLSGDAGFEGALDGVTGEVIGAGIGTGVQEDLRFANAEFGELVKVCAVHGLSRSAEYRKLEGTLLLIIARRQGGQAPREGGWFGAFAEG